MNGLEALLIGTFIGLLLENKTKTIIIQEPKKIPVYPRPPKNTGFNANSTVYRSNKSY